MENKKRPFGLRDQIGYVCGDLGGTFINGYVDAYFLTFCTYVLGMDPFFMGALFFVARVLDAVSAPLIGSIPDRWRLGRSGDRYKPYVLLAAFPLALSGLACFTDVSVLPMGVQQVWVSAAYLLYCVAYSFAAIPYGSLASVMTADSAQRTGLSTCRSLGGLTASMFVALVPQFAFDGETGAVLGERFFQIALVFGLGSLLAYAVLLCNTEEHLQVPSSPQGYSYRRVLKGVARNRPLWGLMLAGLGCMLYGTAMNQLRTYLYKEYYLAPQMASLSSYAQILMMLPAFAAVPWCTKRWGKRRVILAALAFSTVVSLYLVLVPVPDIGRYLVLSSAAMLGNMTLSLLIWAMAIDCIDYQEYITGERNDGSVYSIFTFSRKLGSALASTLASVSLGVIGFASGVAVQTDAVRENIRVLCNGVPLLANLLMLLGIAVVYTLDTAELQRVQSALQQRRSAPQSETVNG